MMQQSTVQRLGPLFVALLVTVFAFGCQKEQIEEEIDPDPITVSRGLITASLNRYIETGSSEPFEQFGLMGMFVRHDAQNTHIVDSFLGEHTPEVDIGLDGCTMPSPVLESTPVEESQDSSVIELLDVGDLSVSFEQTVKPVPTRTFPDLLKLIVGVIYTTDETRGVPFRPGETYSLRATGADEVSKFSVALDAPEDLGEVKVDGVSPLEQIPSIKRGEDLELVWDGDGYGDEVVARLSWTSMGSPWSMTCRMRDDSVFVIPEMFTSSLPDPLTSSDEELTLTRTRQVSFRTEGLSSGSFRFLVSTNFPVRF